MDPSLIQDPLEAWRVVASIGIVALVLVILTVLLGGGDPPPPFTKEELA